MAKQLTKDEAFDMMANDTRGKRPAKAKPKRKPAKSRAQEMDSGGPNSRLQRILQSGRETAKDERN